MSLCIALPNADAYSETFLHNQIRKLEPELVLTEGWHPSVNQEGRSLLPFPFHIQLVRGGFRNLAPHIYHRWYSKSLAASFKRMGIKTVLANYGPMGVELEDACRIAGVRLFVHFHGFDIADRDTLALYGKRYGEVLPKVAGVIAVSGDMKARLAGFGVPSEKLHLNPYGVDTSVFNGAHPGSTQPLFVFVGRFAAKKAPDLTLRAFARVTENCPEARLIMIGAGELLGQSKELAASLGISDSVEFAGQKTPSEVKDYLISARAYVQHSRQAAGGDSEGTPNTILEASSTGLPIISTRHGGIREAVVHGETGLLCEEGDWETMAANMMLLARDPLLAGTMGNAARLHIQRYYEMNQRINHLKAIIA